MAKLNTNTITIKLKEWLTEPESHPKEVLAVFLGVALVLGGLSYGLQYEEAPEPLKQKSGKPIAMDTFVPDGKILLQITVANYESLDRTIGHFGVVDLYTTPLNPTEKSKKLAYAVKIAKAPGNPRFFYVLLSDQEAAPITSYRGEFTVAIRNPKVLGTKVVTPKKAKPKRQIVYEWESL